MNSNLTTVAAWSYGIAGAAYAAFAFYLFATRRSGPRSITLLCATVLTAAWAALSLAFTLTHLPGLFTSANIVDALRAGAWFTFLVLLGGGATAMSFRRPRVTTWLAVVATTLVALAVLAEMAVALQWSVLGNPARF